MRLWAGPSEGYEYVAVDGGVRIERCTVRAQSLVMPEFIDGMPVTAIAPYAFEGNADIRDLACPPQVMEIGSRAFANCLNLERISLPARLARYENSWVAGCARLEEIVLPGSNRRPRPSLSCTCRCEAGLRRRENADRADCPHMENEA